MIHLSRRQTFAKIIKNYRRLAALPARASASAALALAIAVGVISAPPCYAEAAATSPASTSTAPPPWSDLSTPLPPALPAPATQDAKMAWFRQAKYGLFIHWGLYALPAGVWNGKPVRPSSEWVMAHVPVHVKDYEKLATQFDPVDFNADRWVQMAQDAGMNYIVITAKHGDGFAMFHSHDSSYNIYDATPFHRDPCLELAHACARHHMKLGFYYSQSVDWHEPGGEGNSWDFASDGTKSKNGAFDHYLDTKVKPQLRELLTNYGPICEIFFDTPALMTPERAKPIFDLVHKLQPACLIDGRLIDAKTGVTGDYATMGDNGIPKTTLIGDWETPGELNHNWGYASTDFDYKSPSEVLAILMDVVSKGGNYLLDVGPDAKGIIPEVARDNLLTVGGWLKANGEAVYGAGRSPFAEGFPGYRQVTEKNGRTIDLPFNDWRCTTKPGKLYFTVLHWSPQFKLPPFKNQIKNAYLLSDPAKTSLPVTSVGNTRVLQVPHYAPNVMATVIVVETEGVVRGG